MKIRLLLTPECLFGERMARILAENRPELEKIGLCYPRALGKGNHTKLFLLAHDPGHLTQIRHARGFDDPGLLKSLQRDIKRELNAELTVRQPDLVILAASQLVTTLRSDDELQALKDFLSQWSNDIGLVLHVEDQARLLVRHHAEQVFLGRTDDLSRELSLDAAGWEGAVNAPATARYPEVMDVPRFLNFEIERARWERVFGARRLLLRPVPEGDSASLVRELETQFNLGKGVLKDPELGEITDISSAWLNRCRAMNALLWRLWDKGSELARPVWWKVLTDLAVDGPPLSAGQLSPVSAAFAASNARLIAELPDLAAALTPDAPSDRPLDFGTEPWFRVTQYFAASLPRFDKLLVRTDRPDARAAVDVPDEMPLAARELSRKLAGGRFAPHNNLGEADDLPGAEPFKRVSPKAPRKGTTGTVVVSCMKNEGPYVLEWIAYHRAIGVDKFIVYTNACDDGTERILQRLDRMGIVEHRDNDGWRGKSPQQFALNQAMREEVVRQSDWICHIDVDEFINIKVGNGHLDDLRARIGGATNVAMTWRLFGSSGVRDLVDAPVIGQFDSASPKYCPKPHTVWGYKTMFRNIGAYEKLSCHRPNHLTEAGREQVVWVNGSGKNMGPAVAEKGWRNEIPTIGFDLVQLNHYALRSAEAFLIKRQRGRALHVDRSIGLSYWIRNDWSDFRDTTIMRNLPRLQAEMADLKADKRLSALHDQAVDWHRTRAKALRALPEFADLFARTADLKLTPLDRAAWSLALDLSA